MKKKNYVAKKEYILLRLPIMIKRDKSGQGYVAECKVGVGVWSCGKNKQEAKKNIKEAVKLVLEFCLQNK